MKEVINIITFDDYVSQLSSHGKNMGDIRRRESMDISNYTFTGSPDYKRVRILTQDGWELVDAQYEAHATLSSSGENLDYYLRFRPKVEYPIGSYVIIPNENKDEPNTFEHEKELYDDGYRAKHGNLEQSELWFIIGKSYDSSFQIYDIIQCNWKFQWIYDNKIYDCYGCVKTTNSYSQNGLYDGRYSVTVDNLITCWMPDINYVYKNFKELGIDSNQSIILGTRFMLSNNKINPPTYKVSKIIDLTPQGVEKIILVQDELNKVRDNIDLKICDYYSNTGDVDVKEDPIDINIDEHKTSVISNMILDENEELVENEAEDAIALLGDTLYFKVSFKPMDEEIDPQWGLKILDPENSYSENEINKAIRLIKLIKYDDNTLCVKIGKAGSLIDKDFVVTVQDSEGNFYSESITVHIKKERPELEETAPENDDPSSDNPTGNDPVIDDPTGEDPQDGSSDNGQEVDGNE